MSTTDEIKARIDIVELITESGVRLRRSGRNYTGFCPFHPNKRTPAFVVWPETGTWRCFGECNEGGDAFKYVMKKDGVDFREALTRLAARAGIELPSYRGQAPEEKEAHERLRSLLEEALVFYGANLRQNQAAMTYLREKRGLKETTIETFGLGYALQSFDATVSHFLQRGFSEQDLLDAGLASERQSETSEPRGRAGIYDRFRHRLMIPIRDENGRMAGFGARVLDPQDVPKFLNSPETVLFTKGRLLYGLDRARRAIRSANQGVIVEGYLDVIALHQARYENAVSPMGTALTEEQLRLLKRFTRNIVLALDPDAAGQKAVLRGLEAARQAMDREGELAFDARGLLRNEARMQADLRVAALPDGLDPDEIVARDPEEWKRIIEAARPIIEHVMETLAEGKDLSDRKAASEISGQVLPLIKDLASPEEREFYTQKLARFLRIDERAFLEGRRLPARRRRRQMEPVQGPAEAQADESRLPPALGARAVQEYVLAWLVRRPELLYRLDRLLQEHGLAILTTEDFDYTDDQLLCRLIRDAVQQDDVEPQAFVAEAIPESLKPYVAELMTRSDAPATVEGKVIEELLRGIRRMRDHAASEKRTQYRFLQEEAQADGDTESATAYQDQVLQLTRLKRVLDEFEQKMSMKRME
ncbi:MAG: DNA primase [Anaerolineales bacterium]